MYKILLLGALLPFSLLPTTPISLITIDNGDVLKNSDIKMLKDVFMDAFHSVYLKDWTLEIEEQTHNVFENYISQYQTNCTMNLVIVLKDNQIAGWALFKKENDADAILEILCISPHYWRQGIGKQLAFSICDLYPTINHISLMTRKINPISPQFYEALGFRKTDFSLPEYANIENLLGYEWHKK
ncbi:hypothetical protein BH09DEP1_BH09DEP1_3230 [soil metagenome]